MKLFMQFLIGSAISSFAILIIFAGIPTRELLLQSNNDLNQMIFNHGFEVESDSL